MNLPNVKDTCITECVHCGTLLNEAQQEQRLEFCCDGCENVYQAIHTLGLEQYYLLRGQSRSHITPLGNSYEHHRYADSDEFRREYCTPEKGGVWRFTIALEGIHCAACVWLLERLPIITNGVTEARVRFADAQIDICFNLEGFPSQILSDVERLGYRVHPIPRSKLTSQETVRSQRIDLIRIGIAAVCAMNVMMLAVSLYQGEATGIEPKYRSLLNYFSFALTLPVLFFSAVPFYRTSLGGLRAGLLHIDVPIVIALWAAFLMSTYQTIWGDGQVYYDSVTAVIFLLLFARYYQNRLFSRIAGSSALISALLPIRARQVLHNNECKEVFIGSLKRGDLLEIEGNQVFAADGIVKSGDGYVNLSFLTGESDRFHISPGMRVFAGATMVSGSVRYQIEALNHESRLGQLIADVERRIHDKPKIQVFLDKRSKGFTVLVMCSAIFTFLYWYPILPDIALERTIALLLVTCPCVLALATPIIFSSALVKAAHAGILIRSSEIIERLERIRTIIFDKTGTLSTGKMEVSIALSSTPQGIVELDLNASSRKDLAVLALIESPLEHPIAIAISKYIQSLEISPSGEVTKIEYIAGKGYRVLADNHTVLIGSPSWDEIHSRLTPQSTAKINEMMANGQTVVVYSINNNLCYIFALGDQVREEAKMVISFLRKNNYHLQILSGDNIQTVNHIANSVGIDSDACHAPFTPEEKRAYLVEAQKKAPCTMIGDGINDIGAFSAAEVGIGLIGGAEASLKIADVYFLSGSLSQLPDLLLGSQRVMNAVRRGLVISATYNVFGAIGAFQGWIGPLEAAILMPLSSISSILIAASKKTF